MQFIPTRVHAMADYAIGLLLIAAPWLLGFANGGAAMWVPIILGCGVILYSLMTAYELGAVPLISMPAHLGLDVAGGLLLAASPWIFQFADVIWWPHVVVGILEIGTAAMTQTTPRHLPQHSPSHQQHHTPTV